MELNKQVHHGLAWAMSWWSVLAVALFLGRVGDAVLALGRAGAQAVQTPAVLGVVDVVFKEQLQ